MDLSKLSYTKGDSQTIPGQPAGRIARQNQSENSKYELPVAHTAYQKPEGIQGQWIVSNPCFEIWLYYCFLNNPEEDLNCLKAEPVSTRSQKLKSLCNSLVKGGMNPVRAFELMHAGIDNSKEHYRVDDEGIPVLYATQMHEMAQYLIDTMNRNANEYELFLKMKAEQRAIRHKEKSI